MDEDTLLMLAKVKLASLLRKIGSWHNHLLVEIILNKNIKDRIHKAIFDQGIEIGDIEDIEKEKEELSERIQNLVFNLAQAYPLYDKFGHYKDFPDKNLDKKLAIRSMPQI
eukprot:13376863-Ditylum_brightwellii.AAC.1